MFQFTITTFRNKASQTEKSLITTKSTTTTVKVRHLSQTMITSKLLVAHSGRDRAFRILGSLCLQTEFFHPVCSRRTGKQTRNDVTRAPYSRIVLLTTGDITSTISIVVRDRTRSVFLRGPKEKRRGDLGNCRFDFMRMRIIGAVLVCSPPNQQLVELVNVERRGSLGNLRLVTRGKCRPAAFSSKNKLFLLIWHCCITYPRCSDLSDIACSAVTQQLKSISVTSNCSTVCQCMGYEFLMQCQQLEYCQSQN
jgi:hypothetical protein